ncbi:hydrogen peroxide-inducible genes activator [Roseomonas xinghualingensis]|uniref:hydrogen peroxide-inducible genes activator n=1 Tax=Roseomonas xinghualingensis TaxID=2986475 RepID=UPI0021F11EF4|nr:hydrogen peroxide-inducible genes activator [Roseomonas sp. SXEYE001]MCV4206699.1 hydrogen peroxide-inducible genes activator [Roseomonas sp. SXEYE001]
MTPLPSPQQLRYLVALAEQGHFGRAAAACSVTQSTLSAGVIALERQLDAVILERGPSKRPAFTLLGLELVARAREALSALAAVSEAAQAARDPLTGPLRVGVIPTIGPFLLPRLMPALRAAHPRLQLWLREDLTGRLGDELEAGRLDLLILALPCGLSGVETLAVAEDPFVLAMPESHRLAARSSLPTPALATERLLLLEDGHCLREHALAACRLPAARAGEGFSATSLHTLVQMVAGGLGVTLLPRLAVEGGVLAGANLALRPLDEPAARMLGLAWRTRSPRAAEFQGLAQVVREAIEAVG